MFLNLFFYELLQPRLYLFPFAVEQSVHHCLLLRQKAQIFCRKLMSRFLFLRECHNPVDVWGDTEGVRACLASCFPLEISRMIYCSAAKVQRKDGRALVIFFQNSARRLSFSSKMQR